MLNLKAQRESLKLTLEDVGNYVGVGKSTVRKWENGMINNMGRDKILKYAKILQIFNVSQRFITFQNTIK